MQVQDAMTNVVVTVGPEHMLTEAVKRMVANNVGAAVVADPESEGVQIITERDVMKAIASGVNPDAAPVFDHTCANHRYAEPEWLLEKAAKLMVKIGVRHLVVIGGDGEVLGMLSMRDIVRCQVLEVNKN